MSVSGFVPSKVSSGAGRGRRSLPYLTGDSSGWRFQMRLSTVFPQADFGIAGAAPILRAPLGPRSRREAKQLARMLAGLCQIICSAATGCFATMELSDDAQRDLFQQVAQVCQEAIATALAEPSQAVMLAQAFGGALTSLQLVQQEVAKGERGAAAVVRNADALTRQALTDVLTLASHSEAALAALAAAQNIAPRAPEIVSPPPAAPSKTESHRVLPLFSRISQDYIDMRIAKDGEDHADIQILRLRRQTFIDVAGDRTPDEYFPSDLQTYVNKMQFWPANVTKRADTAGRSTLEILERNGDFSIAPAMAKKTMADGYLANIKTMMRHRMQDLKYHDPFYGAKVSFPKAYRASKPREGVSIEVTNRVFATGVKSNLLDEAMLPLLAKLTSRRLGLLTYLQGSDIRQKDGVWVAQTNGIVEVEDPETGKKTWQRVPIKTEESMTYYVLHNFLDEIGFISFMRAQNGFVFKEAHNHPNPSKYMSKTMQNHLKRCGAKGGEVFHSLRGDGIDGMRTEKVDSRARRLQAGHELGDEHEKYGFRALSREACQRLANLPLEPEIDWSVFKGLDFDALARGRRSRGRRLKTKEG